MWRLEQITRAGYLVKVEWECEFDDAGRPAHPIVQQSPLCTPDALYGGRTEAMRLYYKSRENETIQYVNVMSLNPYYASISISPLVIRSFTQGLRVKIRSVPTYGWPDKMFDRSTEEVVSPRPPFQM